MLLRTTPFILCLAITAADCAWDAKPGSDFITSGAGEAVANAQVQQATEIWPPASLDNDIEYDASRLLAPPAVAAAPAQTGPSGTATGSQ